MIQKGKGKKESVTGYGQGGNEILGPIWELTTGFST